jgi:hypothetical protein
LSNLCGNVFERINEEKTELKSKIVFLENKNIELTELLEKEQVLLKTQLKEKDSEIQSLLLHRPEFLKGPDNEVQLLFLFLKKGSTICKCLTRINHYHRSLITVTKNYCFR